MQSVSSRIWTRVAVFISYDDNDYTPGTSQQKPIGEEPSSYFRVTINEVAQPEYKAWSPSLSVSNFFLKIPNMQWPQKISLIYVKKKYE